MKSLIRRYDATNDLEAHADALAGSMPGDDGPAPSPVHIAAVDLLGKLTSLAERSSSESTPPQVRVLMSLMRQLRPAMLDSFRKVDPAVIREFFIGLRADLDAVITADDRPPPPAVTAGAADPDPR